ncbi:MAG TPA: pilus assembly protein PilM [Armatimonadota bacterium]|jgi:type IV pilus assembly protein PilM
MLGLSRCLGVEISETDIKLVELRKSNRGYEVIQAVRMRLSGEESSLAVAQELARYLAETATPVRNIVCSLPTHACSVKFAEVPRGTKADIARVVHMEAQAQIPLPLTELEWDFSLFDDPASPMCLATIAGARRDQVREQLAKLELAELHPRVLTISALAGALAVADPDAPEEPSLMLDIEARWTDLCMLAGERVIGCRSLGVGADDLRSAFAQDYTVDQEEADQLLWSRGVSLENGVGADDDTRPSAVNSWVARLVQDLRQSTGSLATSTANWQPKRVQLVGMLAGVPGLAEALSQAIGVPVKPSNPWDGIHVNPVCTQTLRESPASYAVATGLAWIGLHREKCLNLMPRQLADDRIRRRKEVGVLTALGLAVVLLAIGLLPLGASLKAQQGDIDALLKQKAAVASDIKKATTGSATSSSVKDIVDDIERETTNPLEILRGFSKELPRGLSLSDFSYENGKSVVMKGSALSNAVIADAISSLSSTGSFTNVVLDYANQATNEAQQVYDFQITCQLPAKAGVKAAPGKKPAIANSGEVRKGSKSND